VFYDEYGDEDGGDDEYVEDDLDSIEVEGNKTLH
jgi:hypothetical protein